jgi:hypothetical protein
MCPNVHFVGKKEFERHTGEQHKQSLLSPCRYSTSKRHEYPFARKENLIRHIKSQHSVDQPNSPVSGLMTQKRLRAFGEDQQPQINEYSTSEKEDQSRLERPRIQEGKSEMEHLRLENDRLRGENDDLKRQLQNLKGKYDERELINSL